MAEPVPVTQLRPDHFVQLRADGAADDVHQGHVNLKEGDHVLATLPSSAQMDTGGVSSNENAVASGSTSAFSGADTVAIVPWRVRDVVSLWEYLACLDGALQRCETENAKLRQEIRHYRRQPSWLGPPDYSGPPSQTSISRPQATRLDDVFAFLPKKIHKKIQQDREIIPGGIKPDSYIADFTKLRLSVVDTKQDIKLLKDHVRLSFDELEESLECFAKSALPIHIAVTRALDFLESSLPFALEVAVCTAVLFLVLQWHSLQSLLGSHQTSAPLSSCRDSCFQTHQLVKGVGWTFVADKALRLVAWKFSFDFTLFNRSKSFWAATFGSLLSLTPFFVTETEHLRKFFISVYNLDLLCGSVVAIGASTVSRWILSIYWQENPGWLDIEFSPGPTTPNQRAILTPPQSPISRLHPQTMRPLGTLH